MATLMLDTRWCAQGPEPLKRCVLRALPQDRRATTIMLGVMDGSTTFTWEDVPLSAYMSCSQPLDALMIAKSCKLVALLAGLFLTEGKTWEQILSITPCAHEVTHLANGRTGTIVICGHVPVVDQDVAPTAVLINRLRLTPSKREVSTEVKKAEKLEPTTRPLQIALEKQLLKQDHATEPAVDLGTATKMRFLDSITVSRSGRQPEEYCRSWNREEVRMNLARGGHTYVEFLACPHQDPQSVPPGKMFLDRDVYVGKDPPTPEVVQMHMDEVRDRVQTIVQELSIPRTNLSFVVATRHGFCAAHNQHKLSFRPFLQGMRIRYTDIPRIIRHVKQTDFWDMSVYKASEQLLATIMGCKGRLAGVHDSRVLLPEPGHADPLLYIVQDVDDSWPLLDLPCETVNVSTAFPLPAFADGATLDSLQISEVLQCFVRALLACLGACSSNDRRVWITIGMVVKGVGNGDLFYEDWLNFSRRGSKFGGEHQSRKTWEGLRVAAGTSNTKVVSSCGMGTLCYHAKQDNAEGYALACNIRAQAMAAGTTQSPRKGKSAKRLHPSVSIAPTVGSKRASVRASQRITAVMKKLSQP